jgi:hypothetical protein
LTHHNLQAQNKINTNSKINYKKEHKSKIDAVTKTVGPSMAQPLPLAMSTTTNLAPNNLLQPRFRLRRNAVKKERCGDPADGK